MNSENVRITEKVVKTKKPVNFGLISLILGIAAVVLAWLPLVAVLLGLAAIIFGVVALIKKRAKGKSIAGIVLGAVSFLLAVIITLLSAVLGIVVIAGIVSLMDGSGSSDVSDGGMMGNGVIHRPVIDFEDENSDISFDMYSIYDGTLLYTDSITSYKGTAEKMQLASHMAPTSASGTPLYRVEHEIYLTPETIDAFNAMIEDCYAENEKEMIRNEGQLGLDSPYSPATATPYSSTAFLMDTGTCLFLTHMSVGGVETAITDANAMKSNRAYEWLVQNAYRYGFVRESTHSDEQHLFRYVGVPHSYYIEMNDISVYEYVCETRNYTYPGSWLEIVVERKDYAITYHVYYLSEKDKKIVPEDKKFTVSGDNLGGFVVAVEHSVVYMETPDSYPGLVAGPNTDNDWSMMA